jgi:hypothetical protein
MAHSDLLTDKQFFDLLNSGFRLEVGCIESRQRSVHGRDSFEPANGLRRIGAEKKNTSLMQREPRGPEPGTRFARREQNLNAFCPTF